MRMTFRSAVLALVLIVGMAVVQAHSGTAAFTSQSQHVMLAAPDLKWGPAPPGLPAGGQLAVLSGDPGKAAPFTISVKLPSGYLVPPHWHPADENVVIVTGTLLMGMGDKINDATMKDMGPGSFALLPAKTNHYVRTKGVTTLVISGMGPFEITYVNPNDDPRNKKAPIK